MTDYKATPEQWAAAEHFGHPNRTPRPLDEYACILELRARVETLEAASQKHIVETSANILALASRVEALEVAKRQSPKVLDVSDLPQWTPEQAQQIADLLTPNSSAPLSSSNYPEKPDSSLVDQVLLEIENGTACDRGSARIAREVILSIATWVDRLGYHSCAAELRKEVPQSL